MLSVLWEIVLPLLVAFVVGWVVMGWLTWRWRRSGVSTVRWLEVNEQLTTVRSELAEAEAKVAEFDRAGATGSPGQTGNGTGGNDTSGNGTAPATESVEPAPVDDLKAIRGIGLKMEAKLLDLGVTSLHQVAAFTEDEIERVSAGIGAFPGRIERDRWVPQAKALVAELAKEDAA